MSKTYAIGIDVYGKEYKFVINYNKNIWCNYINLKSLKVYDKFNELTNIFCYGNQLEKLIIYGGKNIDYINCQNNKLKELDLSMCKNLKYLYCDFIEDKKLKLPNKKLDHIKFY